MSRFENIGCTISIALIVFFFYFAGLILAVKSHYSKTMGESYLVWSFLSVLAGSFFCYISSSLIITSSPSFDVFWYYLGWSVVIANGIGFIIVIYNFTRAE